MEAWLAGCTLVLTRVAAFVWFAPLIGGGFMPRTVKVGWIVALTYFWLMPMEAEFWRPSWQSQASDLSSFGWALMIAREVLLGSMLGFAFSLFVFPARMAGDLIAGEIGLTFGTVVSAKGDGSAGPLSTFLEAFATTIFFSIDAHHLFLASFDEWLRRFPIGSGNFASMHGLTNILVLSEHWAVLLAAPVLLGLFLTTVVLLMLARAAPQLNLYSVGFPLRIGVGLFLLHLAMPIFVTRAQRVFWHLIQWLEVMG